MIQRIKDILFKPKETWPQIKAEATGIGQVFTGYAMILAAFPAVFGLLGFTLVGQSFGPITGFFRIPFTYALVWAIVWYVLILVALYVEGLVINALAPSFGSKQNPVNAYKLAVYSSTPMFVAGILNIVPALGILVFLISLYSFFLLYIGMPVMMETPKEKHVGYYVVTLIVMLIIYFIVGGISSAVMTAMWRPVLF
ncbi:MAG: Yip1 family protein [bacterium]